MLMKLELEGKNQPISLLALHNIKFPPEKYCRLKGNTFCQHESLTSLLRHLRLSAVPARPGLGGAPGRPFSVGPPRSHPARAAAAAPRAVRARANRWHKRPSSRGPPRLPGRPERPELVARPRRQGPGPGGRAGQVLGSGQRAWERLRPARLWPPADPAGVCGIVFYPHRDGQVGAGQVGAGQVRLDRGWGRWGSRAGEGWVQVRAGQVGAGQVRAGQVRLDRWWLDRCGQQVGPEGEGWAGGWTGGGWAG